ncbi:MULTISPECIES: hypothetical protein [unclassified Alteromonas]|uniref:hypothetical protein n=1 Tax=unclassified Alteromonas TaxID=2614992 RepID=UPI000509B4AE|nr:MULTISPECIES: hypothetical protein [unclassified Alteromonas]
MEKFIKSKLLKADLVEIDRQFEDSGFKDISSIILVKQAFVGIANLVDFELTVRSIYAEHRNLSDIYAKASKEFEFAKYLRNKFIGHIKPELLEKAIEWKPELRYMIKDTDKPEVMFMYNLWVLETAINTYIKPDGSHKLFESETDLVYPPDLKRFLIFLTHVVKSGIEYLEALRKVLGNKIEMLDHTQQGLEHWLAAGETDFMYIKK